MKVLVACEFSGIVRDAFIAKGHDAVSCDLLPTESPGPHIQGDVLEILDDGWDLMIAHPPCTYLSYVGMAHWNKPGRAELREKAMGFFTKLYKAPIHKICIENPRGYPCKILRKPDQIVNPYDFGEPVRKRTCLWFKNLPPLFLTGMMEKPPYLSIGKGGKKRHFVDSISSGKNQNKIRSRFWPGIANAMATQWG